MLYDEDDEKKEEGNDRTCEWCHMRPAMEEHFIFGLGRLRLCEQCATMLLASIMDSG